MAKIKIVVISDTHAGDDPVDGRRCDIADILLLRAIHRVNRWIKPDIVLLPGDLADAGATPSGRIYLQQLAEIVEILDCPAIIIPGNHDCDADSFYELFARPAEHTDVNGYRFVCFLDREEPGWNASRSEADIERMRRARSGFSGPIIALQHVPVFPSGAGDCPYNYTNADQVIAAMHGADIFCAISGHYHPGMNLISRDGLNYLAAPGLSEEPFRFLEIDIADRDISVTQHQLKLPSQLQLVDQHIHTQFAYCSENMDMARTVTLAETFGLAGIVFAEHSGQLYFTGDDYWSGRCFSAGIDGANPQDSRMADYLAAARLHTPYNSVGLELDADYRGRAVLRPEDRDKAGVLLGSVHQLPELSKARPNLRRLGEQFLANTQNLLGCGVDILAHPLRVFPRAGLEVPTQVIKPLVRMLVEAKVAAEVNLHCNYPPREFVELCLEAGAKLSFGSDAHNLYQIGELSPHIRLLREYGYDGDFSDILFCR